MPLQSTSGAATYDAFGSAAADRVFIEDVFSTYLYTGNGSTQTITNGIDLSTKGGMVWLKGRSGATDHALYDTARGTTKDLVSNSTAAETTQSTGLTAFNTTGFSIGALAKLNTSSATYASWTFRKQAKFFDVVTYTGNGASNRVISHNLGSTPGFIVVKNLTYTGASWNVYHRSLSANQLLYLNLTNAAGGTTGIRNVTSTTFTLGDTSQEQNFNGHNYVAYLFAHDAGGFGLSGTDNVISCGSFTTDGSGNFTVTLGYEPQWIMYKASNDIQDWEILDVMRGLPTGGNDANLKPNTAAAESSGFNRLDVNATGFASTSGVLSPSITYIYIAIRRGPMKVPTSGTSVFSPVAFSGTGASATVNAGFPSDSAWLKQRNAGSTWWQQYDRLRGNDLVLASNSTNAETNNGGGGAYFTNTQNGITLSGTDSANNGSGGTYGDYFFRRAPSFFDVVCYTGTGSATTFSHNLTVAPELMIVKRRDTTGSWITYWQSLGATKYQVISTATPGTLSTVWNDTAPTSSVFTVGTDASLNASSGTYVAYLFATVVGVSKVGSYTGNGSNQTINCGFTGGSRFVLIKRTDSTGDWYVWDSARGIVSGNDPHLSLNDTAAEVTTDDSVDTDSTGFIVNQLAATNINVSSASYIFLAIA